MAGSQNLTSQYGAPSYIIVGKKVFFHFHGKPAAKLIFMCNRIEHKKSKVGFVYYYEEINDYISG